MIFVEFREQSSPDPGSDELGSLLPLWIGPLLNGNVSSDGTGRAILETSCFLFGSLVMSQSLASASLNRTYIHTYIQLRQI